MNELITLDAAAELIRRGVPLALAGQESALDRLPAGNWIAGTIPYFMVSGGATVIGDDKVFATDLSRIGSVRVATYGAGELENLARNGPDNGFALTIIPAGSDTHARFACEAPSLPQAFLKPIAGWIAGVHLSELDRATPKVYDGRTASKHADRAVVAYVELPQDRMVTLEVVNLFEADEGAVLQFDETSFSVRTCRVDGRRVDFADYVRSRGLADGRLPLVGDYAGARVNVSLRGVDERRGVVDLYAPVFSEVEYRFARPVADYASAFRARLADVDPHGVVMGCNCVLNFVFGELEGRAIGGIAGPITFGEIAYQLLNQTLVMIRVN